MPSRESNGTTITLQYAIHKSTCIKHSRLYCLKLKKPFEFILKDGTTLGYLCMLGCLGMSFQMHLMSANYKQMVKFFCSNFAHIQKIFLIFMKPAKL